MHRGSRRPLVPRFVNKTLQRTATCIHALCARRWGDSPLKHAQSVLFLKNTIETRQLGFVDHYHDKSNIQLWMDSSV